MGVPLCFSLSLAQGLVYSKCSIVAVSQVLLCGFRIPTRVIHISHPAELPATWVIALLLLVALSNGEHFYLSALDGTQCQGRLAGPQALSSRLPEALAHLLSGRDGVFVDIFGFVSSADASPKHLVSQSERKGYSEL